MGNMGPGKAFGELAILYNCTRTASVRGIVCIFFITNFKVITMALNPLPTVDVLGYIYLANGRQFDT